MYLISSDNRLMIFESILSKRSQDFVIVTVKVFSEN